MMPEEHKNRSKASLALALSRGITAAKWGRSNEVPKVTAYRWAKDPAVRKAVDTYRRRMIDRAVGVLTQQTAIAAGGIARIAKQGDNSDSVQLKACRAVIADMITTSKYASLEYRVTDMEKRVRLQHDGVNGAPASMHGHRSAMRAEVGGKGWADEDLAMRRLAIPAGCLARISRPESKRDVDSADAD